MKSKSSINIHSMLFERFKWVFLGVFVMLIGVLAYLGFPWIMKTLIDVAIPKREIKLISLSIIGLIVLPIVSTALTSVSTIINLKIGGQITDHLRHQMAGKILRLSPKTLNNLKVGDVVGRLLRSTGEVGDMFIRDELLPAISSLFMFSGILGLMLYFNWMLALVSLLTVPFVIFLGRFLGHKTEKSMKELNQLLREGDSYFTELVGGIKTVQMFGQEEQEERNIKNFVYKARLLRNKTAFFHMWFMEILYRFELSLGTGIVFALGVWQVINDKLTIGSLVAFTVYIPQLYDAISKIQKAYVGSKKVNPIVESLQEILDLQDEIADDPKETSLKSALGNIVFKDVSFSYEKDRGNVHNLSFKIKSGEFIGIVGPTGGGKTTILELIMRFYDPDHGEIWLDDLNIKKYRLSGLRQQIALVSQDIFLWNRSIIQNLLYAKPNALFTEIIEACKSAQILDFIRELPDGFETVIGERGVKLSGGEKQRLSIARAILRNPQILLMDEPTSALDANTESLLQHELERIFEGKTVVVVAHRLATIRNADRIIVVKDGTIKELGSHEELMKKRSIYYQLYTEQFQHAVTKK